MSKRARNRSTGARYRRIDRSVVVVGSMYDQSNDRAFWLSKTPDERMEAIQYLREIAYGHDAATARLARVLEVAELPRRTVAAPSDSGHGGSQEVKSEDPTPCDAAE